MKRELRWIEGGSQSGAAATAATAPRRRLGARLAWAIALLSAASALALSVALMRSRAVPSPQMHAFLLPPEKTSFELTGDEAAPPALSPDGEQHRLRRLRKTLGAVAVDRHRLGPGRE